MDNLKTIKSLWEFKTGLAHIFVCILSYLDMKTLLLGIEPSCQFLYNLVENHVDFPIQMRENNEKNRPIVVISSNKPNPLSNLKNFDTKLTIENSNNKRSVTNFSVIHFTNQFQLSVYWNHLIIDAINYTDLREIILDVRYKFKIMKPINELHLYPSCQNLRRLNVDIELMPVNLDPQIFKSLKYFTLQLNQSIQLKRIMQSNDSYQIFKENIFKFITESFTLEMLEIQGVSFPKFSQQIVQLLNYSHVKWCILNENLSTLQEDLLQLYITGKELIVALGFEQDELLSLKLRKLHPNKRIITTPKKNYIFNEEIKNFI